MFCTSFLTPDVALEFFLQTKPGLEPLLAAEAHDIGLKGTEVPGGVECVGDWRGILRANMKLRIPDRVLVRVAQFRAMHPAQLDKRARKVDWASWLPQGADVRVDAITKKSRIYHAGAAKDRIAGAIRAALGDVSGMEHRVFVRIIDDLCTISLDTSGEALHKRGHKVAVGKAPMRETLAAAFLRACGYDGTGTVVDPMCGSGTFLIEAAEIAAGLAPGRARRFAFEDMLGLDGAVEALPDNEAVPENRFFGFDRDTGAIGNASKNAERAGVGSLCTFVQGPISDLQPPEGPPGLVIVNPPYGSRIGKRKLLFGLYGSFGKVMAERFKGWRVGMVTSDGGLAKATGLNMTPRFEVPHGGLKVTLWTTEIT
ncbi:MAG: class I SAM-dependent RNA methyltransferase [Pseudomonadota bacterium]